MKKWYSLIDKVWKYENLEKAMYAVAQNRGAAGIDRQSTENFVANKEINLQEIHRLLRQKQFQPLPVRAVDISKDNGKSRTLGIPTVKDRVVQQALRMVIEPIFEAKFKGCSYGFRPGRNCHQAINKVEEYIRAGNTWVVEADIQNCFDSIDHELLIDQVAEEISDGSILKLIKAFLKSGIMKEGSLQNKDEGTPQGGVISPLLANIYLHQLDVGMSNFKLVRYADDLIILCQTAEEADKAYVALLNILGKLKLKANLSKTRKLQLNDNEGIEFLGFRITAKYKFPRKKAVEKFKIKVRSRTRRTAPVSLKEMIENLNPVIRGWANYFKIGNSHNIFERLDSWIRMRLRCFIEKRKSYMANYRYTNKFFEVNGLVSLLALLQNFKDIKF